MKRIVTAGVILLLFLWALFGGEKGRGLEEAAECLSDALRESEACGVWFFPEDKGERA